MFNPKALEIARKSKGFSKRELSNILSLSQQTLSEWESGKVIPKAENIINVANILGFAMEFFYTEANSINDNLIISFRALSKMKSRDRDVAISSAKLAILLNNWLESKFNLPDASIPFLPNKSPIECAYIVRSLWNLEDCINNTIYLLESHGVRVYSLIENSNDYDALSTWHNNIPYIFLNTTKSSERCRFDAMHELGHLIMHKGLQPSKKNEEEANIFASEILMPQQSVYKYRNNYRNIESFLELKKLWKVSLKALIYRYHKLNLLSDWDYRRLNIEIVKKGFNESEPYSINRETSIILTKIIKMLKEDNFTIQDIANYTKIPTEYINKLMFNMFSISLIYGTGTFREKSKADLKLI